VSGGEYRSLSSTITVFNMQYSS